MLKACQTYAESSLISAGEQRKCSRAAATARRLKSSGIFRQAVAHTGPSPVGNPRGSQGLKAGSAMAGQRRWYFWLASS